MQETLCALLIAATTLAVQSSSPSDWIGVWQGELDGQPSVTLTLAEDSGTLEGTLVLNIINRDNGSPRIVAHEAHVLLQTRTQGNSLTFQVKRIDRSAERCRSPCSGLQLTRQKSTVSTVVTMLLPWI